MIKIEMKLPRNPKKFKKKIEPVIEELSYLERNYPCITKNAEIIIKC